MRGTLALLLVVTGVLSSAMAADNR